VFCTPPPPSHKCFRVNEDNSWTVVWRSHKVENSLEPDWGIVRVSLSSLCNCDYLRPLRLTVWEYFEGLEGKHEARGYCTTSLEELMARGKEKDMVLEIIDVKKQATIGKEYINSGLLISSICRIESSSSFMAVGPLLFPFLFLLSSLTVRQRWL
jgi:hypothetical protein